MDGRIPRPGGRRVKGGNRSGVVYESSAEEAAFHRWQEEKFQEVERQFAGRWRAQLNALDLDALAKSFQSFGIDKSQCKTFDDAATIARGMVEGTDRPYTRLGIAVNFFKVPKHLHGQVIERWQAVGQPPLAIYAPYAAYVLTVDIFFYTALAAGLISTERRSNRTDIAYLYYLPFCMMFVSSDKLHARCAELFCRKDQNFVWGPDLKADLRRLNEHYLALPEADRDRGIMRFAGHPPNEGNYLTTKLWHQFLRPHAMEDKDLSDTMDPEASKKLLEEFKAFREGVAVPGDELSANEEDFDTMSIERHAHKKKGSWYQLPKDLEVPPEK